MTFGFDLNKIQYFVVTLLNLMLTPVYAANIIVSDLGDGNVLNPDTCTLRQAVASANNDNAGSSTCIGGGGGEDIITFDSSIVDTIRLTEPAPLVITSDLVINGSSSRPITINGMNNASVFEVRARTVASFTNLVITGGNASFGNDDRGGGIRTHILSTLNLRNCDVIANNAMVFGGGIYAFGSNVNIETSNISSNFATGLYATGAIINVNDSSFQGNTERGIAISGSVLDLKNSTVHQNFDGGILASSSFSNPTVVNIDDTQIVENTTIGSGGGISVGQSAAVTIRKSLVSGNSADRFGGGVSTNLGSSIVLIDSTIAMNSAGLDGGGVSVSAEATANLTRSTISNNVASGSGGGVRALDTSGLSINNSTVSSNMAVNGGGGIVAQLSRILLKNSTVSGNTANSGGGLLGIQNSRISFESTLVSGNVASSGAEVSNSDSVFISDSNNLFGHNSLTVEQAFENFSSGSKDINATADSGALARHRPTPLAEIITQLGDNGGATQTHNLIVGSPAIGAGGFDCSGTDQRNRYRRLDFFITIPSSNGRAAIVNLGDKCDIGSVEF